MSPKKGFSVPVAEWISKKARLSGELVAAQPLHWRDRNCQQSSGSFF